MWPIVCAMNNAVRPSQSRLRRASSPRGRAKGRGVIPFTRRGCIRYAPGPAHRPFPTVSLMCALVQPTLFKNARFLHRMSKRSHPSKPQNCQLSTVNFFPNCQLSIVNCQFETASIIPHAPLFLQPLSKKIHGAAPAAEGDAVFVGGEIQVHPVPFDVAAAVLGLGQAV